MSKLIVGCGYLGRRVARRWLAAGHNVVALTRRTAEVENLHREGIRALVADVTRPETLVGLPTAETVLYAVGRGRHSSTSPTAIYVDGLRAVLDALAPETRRLIFVSSTGVYGQTDGGWVDEDSPCRPTRESAQALLEGERVLRDHALGDRAIILRLAGLYGPDRIPSISNLLAGKPVPASADGFLNLIHVDDAAEVVLAAEARAVPPRTYLVSDGHPVRRRTYYERLAELAAAPPPCFVPTGMAVAGRTTSNKRVNSSRMLRELGVQLTCPSFNHLLRTVFDDSADTSDGK